MVFFSALGIIGDGNYEIHFPNSSRGYVSFSDIVPAKGGFTICFWLQTENAGFFVEYRTAASADQNETLTLGLYCGNNTFDILFGNQRRYQFFIVFTLYMLKIRDLKPVIY